MTDVRRLQVALVLAVATAGVLAALAYGLFVYRVEPPKRVLCGCSWQPLCDQGGGL